MKKNTILIITGPTASGKTKLGIDCANLFNGEIISADSMQIYKDLNIGTAKPNIEELCMAKHHLIDLVEPNEEFSVQQFVTKADRVINDLFNKNKLPIIVGGTGLYIKSLIYPYSFCKAPKDEAIRKKYKDLLELKGKEYIYSLLQDKDPVACNKIHINDTKRVIRALEICEITGNSKTSMNIEELKPKYNCIFIALNMPRDQLYDRINQRVEIMFNQGLLGEIETLKLNNKINRDNQSMQAIGYKEFFDYFDGKLTTVQLKELIAKNSRNYAKRQITFIKGFNNVNWFNPLTEYDKIIDFIKLELEKND
ncbi:MAG: tRNA (adenosine(37)-N6)-dimethylallyltransferase MiaA [Clostridia bacterium]|nr:tRNA (adenosine(37)-N6)-dimethylallyltransferase MiaA [Clostridia bacterium]